MVGEAFRRLGHPQDDPEPRLPEGRVVVLFDIKKGCSQIDIFTPAPADVDAQLLVLRRGAPRVATVRVNMFVRLVPCVALVPDLSRPRAGLWS